MKNLFLQIQEDMNVAQKCHQKEKKLILSTVIGEVQRTNPNVIENGVKVHSNEKVIGIIKKMVEANKLTNNLKENEIIETYLPTELTLSQLRDIVKNYVKDNHMSGIKDMGKVMKYLKENYNGQYDGSVASDIAKSVL